MPFHGRFGDVRSAPSGLRVLTTSRVYNDAQLSLTTIADPLLEGLPTDGLYRHAPTGLVCATDARIDAALDLAEAQSGAASVFAHAYLKFGTDFLSHILGDFSGVLWDPRQQRLLLFVDRVAMHGLYYVRSETETHFSTDLRHFRMAGAGRVDFDRLSAWAGDPPGVTLAGGGTCERLPPGHMAIIERQRLALRRYWNAGDAPDIRFPKDDDYVDAAEALLEEAVRCRLPRRLKIGCHLSGGLDSPLIVGTAAKLLAKSGRTLTAFTTTHTDPSLAAIWQGQYWDEHRAAAAFAARFANIEHVQISTDAPGLFDGQQSFLAAAGDLMLCPLSVGAARHAIGAKAQSHGIGVMLTGIAGNETISQDGISLLSYLLGQGRWNALIREGTALWRNGTAIKTLLARTFLPLLSPAMQSRIVTALDIPRPLTFADIIPLAPNLRSTPKGAKPNPAQSNPLRWPTPRQNIAQAFSDLGVLGNAAWYRHGFGMDPRWPFLDSRIIEFCAGLPPDQFCSKGEDRYLARRLLRRLGAPEAHVKETRRGIQYANWHSAMMRARPALYRDIAALEANATASRLLDLPAMRRLVDEMPSASATSRADMMKYSNRLSIGLSIGRFVLHLEGSNAGPPLEDTAENDWQGSTQSIKC